MGREESIDSAIAAFEEKRHELQIFMGGVSHWFAEHPKLRSGDLPIVHSVRSRLKSPDDVKEKIGRKWIDEGPIDGENIFVRITDLAGVRVLHLYQEQFTAIHREIMIKVVSLKDWFLPETPKAYTWDPESKQFFERLEINVEVKESFYTSVHYLLKPREDSPICCELQVRTLFEEIRGEVDHSLNYPYETEIATCREQILVLAKLVGAGSRLVDSIYRSAKTPPP